VTRRSDLAARRRSHLRWGIVAALLVAAATYAAFIGLPRTGGYEVRAVLASASELRPRSAVRIAGVEAGEVTRVERGPGTTALVTMVLDDAARPIHTDATLRVRPRLFLEGNFFVDLRPGSPSTPELEAGGTIPLAQTATPVQLDQVLGALQADGREQLQRLVAELGTAVRGGGAEALGRAIDPAGEALRHSAVTASALRGTHHRDLSAAIADTGRITAALDAHRDQLAALVAAFDATAAAAAARSDELRATVRELAATLRVALPAVREARAAMPAVVRFARDVRPLLRRAPRTLDLARPLLAELRGLLRRRELPALARALRPPLRRLAGLQPGLSALLRQVTPVTDCVRDRALPVLTATLEDGHLTTGQPAWAELLHVMVGLASASQSFDGNGPAVRYLAGFGEQLLSTGRLPGTGELRGLTPVPVEGARPAPPPVKPPFRPDATCREQEPVKLDAPAVGPPPARAAPRVDPALVRRALREARR
jgi:phospholipid/cholesterol/gamma-HCH transport system substrate-binding protein